MATNPLGATISGGQQIRVPDLPTISLEGGLAAGLSRFNMAMGEWKRQLERQLQALVITATTAATTETVTAPVLPQTPAVNTSALSAQISALESDLSAHIAQNIVHGTATRVVGEADEQALDAKTIGQNAPRNAKFRHVLQYSAIDAGETYVIPAGYNLVVAGPFDIFGDLTIEGQFGMVAGG